MNLDNNDIIDKLFEAHPLVQMVLLPRLQDSRDEIEEVTTKHFDEGELRRRLHLAVDVLFDSVGKQEWATAIGASFDLTTVLEKLEKVVVFTEAVVSNRSSLKDEAVIEQAFKGVHEEYQRRGDPCSCEAWARYVATGKLR